MPTTPRRRLMYWLQLASAHLRKRANRELEPVGLTVTQLGALFVVQSTDACRLKDLASALHVNASAVTTLVGRLTRAGLLVSTRSPNDKRAFELHLTPAGMEALSRVRPNVHQLNHALMKGFTDCELDVIERFLKQTVQWAKEPSHV